MSDSSIRMRSAWSPAMPIVVAVVTVLLLTGCPSGGSSGGGSGGDDGLYDPQRVDQEQGLRQLRILQREHLLLVRLPIQSNRMRSTEWELRLR